MTFHDVSAPLRADLPTFPGEQGLRRRLVADLGAGDPATVSELTLGAHTGTHLDAPSHFLADGAPLGAVPLDALIGPAQVVDLTHVTTAITAEDLEAAGLPPGTTRILARTRNSGWSRADTGFREDFVAYSTSAAAWCLDRGVRLLGIDYLSIEPYGADAEGHPVHHRLLGGGVAVLEGLDLLDVAPGEYVLHALPLYVPDAEGAPTRAVLHEVERPDR